MKTANDILKELHECENPVTASSLKTIAISKLKKERDEAEESNESLRNQNTALDEKLAELDWQPIETAPRDGTAILIYDGIDYYVSWYAFDSVFETNKSWIFGKATGPYNAYAEIDTPTHWMPLPEPPKEISL